MIHKEKIKDILLYIFIAIFAVTIWYISFNLGMTTFRGGSIPIGQEYRIKDINTVKNSSFIIVYYDNDKNHTEKKIVSSAYNVFNFTESNLTVPIMKLENTNGDVNYWNIYIPKK